MKTQEAIVFYNEDKAGTLKKDNDIYEFIYDDSYLLNPAAQPISLRMPLQKEAFRSKTLFPFFEGLLPEGWLLGLACRKLKIDQSDKLTLLLYTGKDPVGAVSVFPNEKKRT